MWHIEKWNGSHFVEFCSGRKERRGGNPVCVFFVCGKKQTDKDFFWRRDEKIVMDLFWVLL